MKTPRFGGTRIKEFCIVEEQPGLEDSDVINVQWLECIFPPCDSDLKKIKSSIDNIDHKWRYEILKKADSPFSAVSKTEDKKMQHFFSLFQNANNACLRAVVVERSNALVLSHRLVVLELKVEGSNPGIAVFFRDFNGVK